MRNFSRTVGLFVCVCAAMWAQFDTATVLGTLKDRSGAVVPGAKVTLTNLETGISNAVESDESGNYQFLQVRVGRYRLSAEKAGFSTAVAEEFAVNVGARQRVDLDLAVGQVTETVSVTAAVQLVESENSQRGQIVKQEAIVELPLNGRQYSSLVLLSTGVRPSPIATGGFTTREGSFNVNGLRSTVNNFLLDGTDNNAYGTSNQGFSNQVMQPPPDSVAEFQVVTNNMSAEFGRTGGATINVAYRSGTNGFHGSAWHFLRNDNLNATEYFRPRDGRKAPFNRNQFGFTFGGPIVKNKAFFFTDYEGFRQVSRVVEFSNLPSVNDRQALFSVPIRNPYTGDIYPANVPLPRSVISPFALRVMNDLPAPIIAGRANNFFTARRFQDFTDKYNVKFDYQLTSKLNGFVRVGQRKVNIFEEPGIPGASGGGGNGYTDVMNQQLVTGLTYAATTRDLVEFRFGASRTRAGKQPPGLGSPTMQTVYGIPGLPTDPRVAGGLTTQVITGFTELGRQATNPQWQWPTVFNPKFNYSRYIGKHTLKAGYEYQRIHTQIQDVNPLYGRDTYAGFYSRPAGATVGTNSDYSLADFFFGARDTYALVNLLIAEYRQVMNFFYVQDDWKILPNLTLNLGVRYEYATPQWERDNVLSNFDPVSRTLVPATKGSIENRALIQPDRNNWAPRVGLAYTLNNKTVVRSGFGVNHVHFHRAGGGNILAINGPQLVNALVRQVPGTAGFVRTEQGYPAGLVDTRNFDPLRANITYMPRDFKSSYVMSWFFSVQREIARNTLVDVAYVGNRANGLLLFADFNQARPNAPGENTPLQARRPIPNFSDITYAFNGGWSSYHSLQVRFERRFEKGLFLLNSFTWGKAMDNGGGALEGINGSASSVQNVYDLAAEKGPSPYDQKFTNTTSVLYEMPFGRGRRWMGNANPVVNAILGGWNVGAINNMYSGNRINPFHRLGTAGTTAVSNIPQDWRGGPWGRPNVAGDPLLPSDQRVNERYLNPASFPLPVGTPFGNSSRNPVRMPAFYQFDFSAVKDFALPRESMNLQFRAEFFNLFNVTNYRSVEANRQSAAFGQFTGAFDKRQVQMALRLSF